MQPELSSASDTQKLERRNRELSILNAIAEALNREVDLDRALRTALAQVAELLDLHTGWIFLLDEETGEPYLAAAQNLPPGLARAPQRLAGSCYCLDTFCAGDLDGAANVNVVICSRLRWLVDGTDGLRYHASIPLYAQEGKQLGVLNVASVDWRQLSPDDLRLLYTLGDLTGIAIERARLFARSVQLGAAEERNRLAREIHDTLAQGLAGIVLQLETADALLDAESAAARAQQAVRQALALARSNLEEARRSVLDLRAAPLEGRRLDEALAALAGEHTAHGAPAVTLRASGAGRPLPARVEIGLYRIAQEALVNAARHAAARRVTLELAVGPERVRLAIEDDGRGFDPAQAANGSDAQGYGLIGMSERARLLGGQLEIDSAPGAGTRLEVTVPLEPEP
jgi:two-component system NarL family sensor kinase